LSRPDLNLLITLDVLLAEGNVARAARRLHLSPSAMSRALARLREAKRTRGRCSPGFTV
jgi:DNA-binding transcriptional LysR family regulator